MQNLGQEDPQIFSRGIEDGKYGLKETARESIEPEEIFLDAQISDSPLDERRLETPIKRKVFVAFFLVVFVLLLALFFRICWLQIIEGKEFIFLADRNRLRITPDLSARGLIYDKNMQPLVANVPTFDLLVIPQDLFPSEEKLSVISEILGVSVALIKKELSRVDLNSAESLLLLPNIEGERALALEARIEEFSGFAVARNSIREYIFAEYFSHILGYTAKISPVEVKKHPDYFLTERVGRTGLEQQYQSILRGQPGKKEIEIDFLGKEVRRISQTQPQPGNNIVLNIDSKLQRKIYDSLAKSIGRETKGAAAVALDPRDGKVLALISLPSFDSNLFVKGLSDEDLYLMEESTSQPFFNRSISGQYPPGSTIKPLVASAALEEHLISPTTKIECLGSLSVPSQYNPDIIFRFLDWRAHGAIDLYSAIAHSSNVFFYTIGGGFGKRKGLGPDKLAKYSSLFGFGQASGIDLPGEAGGFIPTPAWKAEEKNEKWYIGDTYHFSIGQGDVLVTPLQIAQLTSVVANSGTLWQPQIVDKIIDSSKNTIEDIEPKAISKNFIDKKNLKAVAEGMRRAVTAGSANSLGDLQVAVAGKTGTAQVGFNQSPHAWFTAFAPFDSPEIVITILVENAGEGSVKAVPIAKEILRWYFDNQ